MIQHTLSTSLALFHVNRDRAQLQDKLDKRRTFLLTVTIFSVVAIGIILWVIRS